MVAVPFEGVTLTGGRSLPFFIGLLFLAVLTIDMLAGYRGIAVRLSMAASLSAFTVWATFTYFWSIDPAASFQRIMALAALFAITVALAGILPSVRRSAITGYIASSTVLAMTVLLQPGSAFENRRAAAGNENDIATVLVIAIALTFIRIMDRGQKFRLAIAISLIIQLAALTATGSRTALIALVAAIAVSLAHHVRHASFRDRVLAFGALFGLAAAFAFIPPEFIPARLYDTPDLVRAGNFTSREIYWQAGLESGMSMIGTGAGSTPAFMASQIGTPAVAHNMLLGVTIEYGLIGLGLFCVALLAILRLSRNGAYWRYMPSLWVGLAIMSLTLSIENRRIFWLVLAFGAASASTLPIIRKGAH